MTLRRGQPLSTLATPQPVDKVVAQHDVAKGVNVVRLDAVLDSGHGIMFLATFAGLCADHEVNGYEELDRVGAQLCVFEPGTVRRWVGWIGGCCEAIGCFGQVRSKWGVPEAEDVGLQDSEGMMPLLYSVHRGVLLHHVWSSSHLSQINVDKSDMTTRVVHGKVKKCLAQTVDHNMHAGAVITDRGCVVARARGRRTSLSSMKLESCATLKSVE